MNVKQILSEVRDYGEELVRSGKGPAGCDINLTMLCGICSFEICKRLWEQGEDAELCFGDGHAFVEYDGKVLDVTATQFADVDEVIIKDKWEAEKIWWWRGVKKRARTLEEVEEFFRGWPFDQRPHMGDWENG